MLILKGGDLLVESSISVARKANIPSFVVGATIVAIATTFPEVSVAILSSIKGSNSLAINTALGSMVCNLALVLGLSFLIASTKISKQGLISKVVFFILSLIVLLFVGVDGKLSVIDGIILIVFFVLFLILNFIEAKRIDEKVVLDERVDVSWGSVIIQFFVSAFAIGFGANVLVANIDNLSELIGVSEGLLGVFIIAVGTNIPELVTTMTAIKLNDSSIGIGNIFGASIIDATMLISVTIFSSKSGLVQIPVSLLFLTIVSLFLITSIIVIPIMRREKSNKLQGFLLIVIFVVYSIILSKIS